MTTRIGCLTACAISMAACPAVGQVDEPFGASASVPLPSRSPAAELLRKPVAGVDWTDRTLADVIHWLQAESEDEVNVMAREKALDAEGITLDALVTLRLRKTTVADVLTEALNYLAPSGEVRYRPEGNKLIISTRADLDRGMLMRVYDLTDLLFPVPDFGQGAPRIELHSSSGGAGQSPFSGSSGEESQEAPQQQWRERLERIRAVIEQTIAPQTWAGAETAAGNGRGRIRTFDRSLIVTNTIEVHEQIAGRLALRE